MIIIEGKKNSIFGYIKMSQFEQNSLFFRNKCFLRESAKLKSIPEHFHIFICLFALLGVVSQVVSRRGVHILFCCRKSRAKRKTTMTAKQTNIALRESPDVFFGNAARSNTKHITQNSNT